MSVSIKMSAKDKQSFNKDIKRYAQSLNVSRSKALDAVALNIRTDAIRILDSSKTTDRGLLKNSITINKTPTGGRRIGTTTGYGLYVEFGRGPGEWPSLKALTGWVRRKLGAKGNVAKSIAFLIGRSIAKRGTKAQPFLRPAYERNRKRITFELRKQIAKNA